MLFWTLKRYTGNGATLERKLHCEYSFGWMNHVLFHPTWEECCMPSTCLMCDTYMKAHHLQSILIMSHNIQFRQLPPSTQSSNHQVFMSLLQAFSHHNWKHTTYRKQQAATSRKRFSPTRSWIVLSLSHKPHFSASQSEVYTPKECKSSKRDLTFHQKQ